MDSITIFGIDPGTRTLGFGWIEVQASNLDHVLSRGCGVIEAATGAGRKDNVSARLGLILRELEGVFAERRPSIVVVEKVFLGKNVSSAFVLGQARGVVLALAANVGAEICEVAAKTAKKSVTGNGGSEKTEVRLVLGRLLGITDELESLPVDASDGLALAYQGWRSLIAESCAQVARSKERARDGVEL